MGEMPEPKGIGDQISSWLSEEDRVRREGFPNAVIKLPDHIGDSVMADALRYPEFRGDYIRILRESYDQLERYSASLALTHLSVFGSVGEWPVKLSDVCAGPFVQLVQDLARAMEETDTPIRDPLNYVKQLGDYVVEKLTRLEWIRYADTYGPDEYTPGGTYFITEKGRLALKPNDELNPWKQWE